MKTQAAILTFAFVLCASAENWTRFRGPNGSGLSGDSIPAKWSEKNFKWRTSLPGVGHGSPVVWGDRVFLLAGNEENADRIPVCVDAKSGKILWTKTIGTKKHRHHRQNTFASSTPAVDAEHVYFTWGTPEKLTLLAYTHDGKQVWDADLGPVKGGHGFGASPVVVGKLLVLNNDQDGKSTLIAVDRRTGQVRWSIPRSSKRLTYSTPCLYRNQKGEDELIFTNWQHGITAVDPKTGNVLWENDDVFGKPSSERAIGSPVIAGDLVIGSCGFVTKLKHVVALRPIPGQSKAEEVWRIERSVPHIPTPIVVGKFIYLWNDQGILTCANNQTGEVYWNERLGGEGYSSAVSADGKIFRIGRDGEVQVIPANGKFEVIATNDLNEKCFGTPAIANGVMFIRTFENLVAISN
ncbi:MAG: PQQ-binding-like beta-propeller repeat protein [Verrucomicrobiia bacterium]|jgi:outer membrane protein assembly factor BamB